MNFRMSQFLTSDNQSETRIAKYQSNQCRFLLFSAFLQLPYYPFGSSKIDIFPRESLSSPLVLEADPLKSPTPTVDRDRTVSRRSKPSSRTSLNGEQPYPWDLLQPQDEMSRHRGAKHRRRYELLGGISLLSPEYLFIR